MTMTSPRIRTPKLVQLIEDVREAVREGGYAAVVAAGVAEALRPYLGDPELLTPYQIEPGTGGRRQHVLHVEEDESFSVVAVVGSKEQHTCTHGHVSWCVVGAHRGNGLEADRRLCENSQTSYLLGTGKAATRPGSIATLTPPGGIQRVADLDDGLTVSLHIYSADIAKLDTTFRRRYDLPVFARD